VEPTVIQITKGVLTAAVGFSMIAWPRITVGLLVTFFGVFAFVDGAANIVLGAQRDESGDRGWSTLFQGVVGVVAAVVIIRWPVIAALALLVVISLWALVTGVLETMTGIRKAREGGWLPLLTGMLSVLLGVVLLTFGRPGLPWDWALPGRISLVTVVGAFVITRGLAQVAAAAGVGSSHGHRVAH